MTRATARSSSPVIIAHVALSRLVKNLPVIKPFADEISIDDLTLKSRLCAITLEHTQDVSKSLLSLPIEWIDSNDFFAINKGIREVTIICVETRKDDLLRHFSIQPKALYSDLVAITIHFDERYMEVPNVLYSSF